LATSSSTTGCVQNYHADSEGVELNFRVMSEAAATFRECAAMPEDWNVKYMGRYHCILSNHFLAQGSFCLIQNDVFVQS
jgi:hypothetical protein